MVLAGADICSGGVGVNRDAEDDIQWIVNTIKAISPPSSLNIRLPKSYLCCDNNFIYSVHK